MNVKDVMNPKADVISPSTTLKEAAEKMERDNVGFLPVGENDELKGTVTDRDIVVRGVCKGKDVNSTSVGDIMTDKVLYCQDSQDVEEVARNMSEQQVRRLPVVDDNKRLVGVVSIGDMAQHLSADVAGKILKGVTAESRAA